MRLPEYNGINKYTTELKKGKQSPYSLIYSLGLAELEIPKTYIETHLKTRFIEFSKSVASILIFFD